MRVCCLANILAVFASFFVTYLTISIIAFLGKAEVSTSFDRISNNRIPGVPAKSKHVFFSGTMKDRKDSKCLLKKPSIKNSTKLTVFFIVFIIPSQKLENYRKIFKICSIVER